MIRSLTKIEMKTFIKAFWILAVLSLMAYVLILELKLKSRIERNTVLEAKLLGWVRVSEILNPTLNGDSILKKLSPYFEIQIDSSISQLQLTPIGEISEYYGFIVKWDTAGNVSIEELKP